MNDAAKTVDMMLGRIAVLEFRIKAMQWLLAGLALPALMLVFSRQVEGDGPLRANSIETRELVLKDQQGRTRLTIGAPREALGQGTHGGEQSWHEGLAPEMTFFDVEKRPRVRIAVSADGTPSFALLSSDGYRALDLRADPLPRLVLNNPRRNLVTLEALAESASLSMYGPTAGDQATIETRSDSSMGMRLYSNGSLRAAIGDIDSDMASRWRVTKRSTSSLLLLDSEGHLVFATPAADERPSR